MRTILISVAVLCFSAAAAIAADSTVSSPDHSTGIEQKKAKMLQHIDQRMALSQQEKVCVQSALSHADLMACLEKFRPPRPMDDKQPKN